MQTNKEKAYAEFISPHNKIGKFCSPRDVFFAGWAAYKKHVLGMAYSCGAITERVHLSRSVAHAFATRIGNIAAAWTKGAYWPQVQQVIEDETVKLSVGLYDTDEFDTLKQERDQALTERNNAETALARVCDERNLLQAQFEGQRDIIRKLQAALDDRNDHISRLMSELITVSNRVVEQAKKIRNTEFDLSIISDSHDDSTKKLNSMTDHRDDLMGQLKEMTHKWTTACSEREAMRSACQRQANTIMNLHAERDTLTADLSTYAKQTEAEENRLIDAEFVVQDAKTQLEARGCRVHACPDYPDCSFPKCDCFSIQPQESMHGPYGRPNWLGEHDHVSVVDWHITEPTITIDVHGDMPIELDAWAELLVDNMHRLRRCRVS